MIEPLRLSFTVACDAAHAFQMFTEKASLWWPYAHSVSAEPGITVTFEPRVGGRIYERTPVNTEYDWGEIVAWALGPKYPGAARDWRWAWLFPFRGLMRHARSVQRLPWHISPPRSSAPWRRPAARRHRLAPAAASGYSSDPGGYKRKKPG